MTDGSDGDRDTTFLHHQVLSNLNAVAMTRIQSGWAQHPMRRFLAREKFVARVELTLTEKRFSTFDRDTTRCLNFFLLQSDFPMMITIPRERADHPIMRKVSAFSYFESNFDYWTIDLAFLLLLLKLIDPTSATDS